MNRDIRSLFPALWAAICLSLAFSAQAHAQSTPAAPDAFVATFYQWFFKHDNDQTAPLREHAIYDYVAQRTVDRLKDEYSRSGPPQGVDYFLKVQDYDPRDWAAHIATQRPISLGDVTIVPVTFGSKDKTGLLVFLRNEHGHWKVVKVDDTWDYN
ncbi:DUF3828 domain-containing protein [Paraburkholderia sp.]|uniref:DUF3828 domain-containing protein n=1 Tax=Paraburkholderia sp. TaxID=1926495 RepID=UPI002600200E|nr:DUF3828 domain-containing protein [Paraburkholderia sp.]